MPTPSRSCDRLDDDHVTAEVHRRWGGSSYPWSRFMARPKTNVGLPYRQGTSEALTRVFKAHGVGTYHRPINTIRSMLVHPKDKTPDAQKCGLVYQVECPECSLTYIGETGRMLATRMKDHLNPRNPLIAVGEQCAHEYHTITKDY